MPQKASIIKPDASGGFKLPLSQGDVARIDVVDVDLVIQAKDGTRYVLAGAGIEAMSDHPPMVRFTNGAASSSSLLEMVGLVETPDLSIPVMSSLTEHDAKTTSGDKSYHGDGTQDAAPEFQASQSQLEAQAEAQQAAQSDLVGPIAEASDATVEQLVQEIGKAVDKLHDKAADPAPVQPFEPPAAPATGVGAAPNPVSLTPLLVLNMGNVVSPTSTSNQLRLGRLFRQRCRVAYRCARCLADHHGNHYRYGWGERRDLRRQLVGGRRQLQRQRHGQRYCAVRQGVLRPDFRLFHHPDRDHRDDFWKHVGDFHRRRH